MQKIIQGIINENDVIELTLYDIKREDGDWFSLSEQIHNSKLILFRHDFSKIHEMIFGDEECETYFIFDEENTNKLFDLFKTKDLLTSLYIYFGEEMRDLEFFDYCKDNGIEYNRIVR